MHATTWFEIPTRDIDRAAAFYGAILGVELKRETFFGVPHALFPTDGKDAVGGALIHDPAIAPSTSGSLVYLNAGNEQNLEAIVGRVAGAGGKVLQGKTSIGPNGFIAVVVDSEGNRAGLHAV